MSSIDFGCRSNALPSHPDGDDLYGRVPLPEHFDEIGYAPTRRWYGEIAVACKRLAEPYDKAKIIIDKKNGRR
jgi:hypothetical protein